MAEVEEKVFANGTTNYPMDQPALDQGEEVAANCLSDSPKDLSALAAREGEGIGDEPGRQAGLTRAF